MPGELSRLEPSSRVCASLLVLRITICLVGLHPYAAAGVVPKPHGGSPMERTLSSKSRRNFTLVRSLVRLPKIVFGYSDVFSAEIT